MKRICYFLLLLATTGVAKAQEQTFDVATFKAPAGWKMETGDNFFAYSRIDGGSWAQIIIYKSSASKGSVEADAASEWNTLLASQHAMDQEESTKPESGDGWDVMSKSGVYQFNGTNVATILTTYSNRQNCFSVVLKATAKPYLKMYQDFIATLIAQAPVKSTPKAHDLGPDNIQHKSDFKFTTTNWDDSWVSKVKENWVEVSKSGIKVLIHYPNQLVDAYSSEKLQGDHRAWTKLIEPRYNSINNVQERGIQDYQSVTFFTADATEKASGKKVYLVLFKKHYDKGNGRYLEVVADSKAVFEKEFGNNYINKSSWEYLDQVKSWDKLANMQNRNKFSVAASDLIGKWSASDYASLSYYYVSSGGFAGATATSISDEFTFLPGNTYQSDHAGASGVAGNQKFSRQVYNGNSLITEWSITLTNRFQGQPEKYNSYFEAIKGGRILVLTDRNNSVKCLVKQPAN
ncbi:hypothetical protein [Pedobacter zeae]|uniref:DUF3472 domain-containing protein n=1 Tax=Pedobacter zeae TaxID=1737356 RepID=A0A7W6K9G4_9SPHI|nr:hypothetical protein [Pedobacter zeae]MBB4107673.1 hypothetical protein [Pedobacter zeae]GGG97817.1 hypothetical protein GCM10007422_09780 [Pedobacter zeae]